MSNPFIRGELHIFADDPEKYLPLIELNDDEEEDLYICIGYDETLEAIDNDEKIIYTTQIIFLSHLYIKAGWDIYFYDNGYVIPFDSNYVKLIGAEFRPFPYYYMLDLYRIGELYQINE